MLCFSHAINSRLYTLFIIHPNLHQPTHRRCVVVTPYSHLPSNPSIAEVTPIPYQTHSSSHPRRILSTSPNIYDLFIYVTIPSPPFYPHLTASINLAFFSFSHSPLSSLSCNRSIKPCRSSPPRYPAIYDTRRGIPVVVGAQFGKG